jgi:hypothetical protein
MPPSKSGEGDSTVQLVPQLPEAVVEVADFEGDYEEWLSRLKEEVKGVNRTNEDWRVATANVHLVVSDPKHKSIGFLEFDSIRNLVKVTAPLLR